MMNYLCTGQKRVVNFAAKFEYISHSIYYVNHNVAEEDPYDKGVV